MFTKSDLKTGMTVELRNGGRYVVFLDTCAQENDGRYKDVLIGINHEYSWLPLSMYNENLYDGETTESGWDIVKVFKPCHPYGMFANAKFNKNSSLANFEKESKKQYPKYGTGYEKVYDETEVDKTEVKVITMDDIFEAFGDNVILKF
jgi:hypothetical protein